MTSTFHQLAAKGIRFGDPVRTPSHEGYTVGRAGRLHFEYVMVQYAQGIVVGWRPHLIEKATIGEVIALEAREAAAWKAQQKREGKATHAEP